MMRNIPIVTKNLLIVNVVAFLACYVMGTDASGSYTLNNLLGLHFFLASDFHIYQLFTYMFMHGGFEHIIFNMFALWMFGCVVERVWGAKKFLFYYITCGIGAGLFQEAAQYVTYLVQDLGAYQMVNTGTARIAMGEYLNMWTTVGASGAIYAILLAFGMIYPNERIFIFPLPIPIKAKYFVIGYAAIELFSALATTGDGVAHIAHLGGMVFGFFMIRHWRKPLDGGYHGSSTADAFDKLRGMFGGRNKKSNFTYTRNDNYARNNGYQQADNYTTDFKPCDEDEASKKATQAEIDRILDKIRKSGYDSLTKDEKQTLFNQTKQ